MAKNKKYQITHLGKTLHTDHWCYLPEHACLRLKEEYYKKPDFELVKKNLQAVRDGSAIIGTITNYYVKDLMAKVKLQSPRWTIEEVFESNDLIRYFWSRVLSSEKVYPKTHSDIDNFESALRLSGGGVAMKPSNYPIKSVDYILNRYNINGKYYDFSCGWGVRLLSAMRNKIEYYGTDPNHLLVDRLYQMANDYNKVNYTSAHHDIRCHGSETFVPEWENTIGLSFSSPPYFSLEDYRIGNQSYKPGTTYQDWLDSYLKPTLENIRRYLIDEGMMLINIKDFSDYKLCLDTKTIAENLGFHYVESIKLKNKTRPSAKVDLSTDEDIMVFSKNPPNDDPTGYGLFIFG
jgi:DNA methylase